MRAPLTALPLLRVIASLYWAPAMVPPGYYDRITTQDSMGKPMTLRPARDGEQGYVTNDGRQWVPVGKGEE